MEHALGDAAHKFGLRGAQRGGSGLLVARGDGLLDLAQEGTDARAARLVDRIALLALAGALGGLDARRKKKDLERSFPRSLPLPCGR